MRRGREKVSYEVKRLEAHRNKSFSKARELSSQIKEKEKNRFPVSSLEEYKSKKEETKKLRKERGRQVISGVLSQEELVSKRLGSAIATHFKKPFLRKPTVQVKTISSSKLLKQYAGTNYGVVKEGRSYQPQEHPVQDNRSLFFQETYNKIKENAFKRGLI